MGAVRFTVITDECVRIEHSSSGRFVDAPSLWAMERGRPGYRPAREPVVVEDREGEPEVEIATPRFMLRFRPSATGLNAETLRIRVHGPLPPGETGLSPAFVEWRPGMPQTENLGGTLVTLDGLRGETPLPEGLLSRDGWYLVDDSRGHLFIDGWVRAREWEGFAGQTDWYFFAYGRDFKAALRAMAVVSGPVPVPRRYLLGSWYSRYWPHTSEEFRAIVADYERHGIPLDVMVLDMDWHRDGWTGWSWNRQLLPDAEELLAWFHQQGLVVTLNLHPADGVGPHEDRYAAFMHAIGENPASGRTVPFDAGNRRYMEALFNEVHRPLEDHGVDFWWLDWQQDREVRSVPGLTNLAWLNHLYFHHTRRDGKRGVSFSRWAGWFGDHRYPIHFSGDAHTGWDMLAFQVPFTATAGNVGCFYWSHDIGGHFGPRLEEATARWVQFGALSAALRLHSARTAVLDRRPWTYEQRFFESMRRAFRLRASLMPYIASEVHRSSAQTVPLLRPMYIDCPDQPRAYEQPGQYRFGEHLIAAPVVRRGIGPACVGKQVVWFPAAADDDGPRAWRRWNTGETFFAGDETVAAATIDETPLFVPEGQPIPLAPVGKRMASGLGEEAIVRLWPGEPGMVRRYDLVEDDGVTEVADDTNRRVTPIEAAWSTGAAGALRLDLAIGPAKGSFAGAVSRRRWKVELGGVRELVRAEVDGARAAGAELDPHRMEGFLRINAGEHRVEDDASVAVEFVPEKPERLNLAHAARRFAAAFGRQPLAGLDEPSALVREVIDECRERGGERAADVLAIGVGIALEPHAGHYRLHDSHGWIDGGLVETEVVDTLGRRTLGHGRARPLFRQGKRSRSAPVLMPGRPLEDPPIGLRATRWVRAEISLGGHPLSFAVCAESKVTPIPAPAWRVIGPFPWNWAVPIFQQNYSPEEGGGRGLRAGDWHDATNGMWVTWKSAVASEKWPVDLRRTLGVHDGLAYALTQIVSSRRQRARLVIEPAEKVEVWLNRVKVFSQDGFDTQEAIDGGVDVTLPTGRSTLMVKTSSGGGGWGVSVAIDGEAEVAAELEPDVANGWAG